MEEIIRINNLCYNDIYHNFNISFPRKKIISISGPNNCGKTLLIRILSGKIYRKNTLFYNGNILQEEHLDNYFKEVGEILNDIVFLYDTLEEEVLSILTKSKKEEYNYLLKSFNLGKYKNISFKVLDKSILIKIKLLLLLLSDIKVLLLDNIGIYFSKEEFLKIISVLKKYQEKKDLTIIITTSNLEEALCTDYLYIINDGNVYLEGSPTLVLEKDNLLNKIGLEIPFMVDLSVKLKDYELVDTVILDMKRMVDKLWK